MKIGKYFNAVIIGCIDSEYWYADMIGEIVRVKKWAESSWGVSEKVTGRQIAPHDYMEI